MSNSANTAKSSAPASLQQHAEANLKYIRDTMERATSFTGVSGKGYVLAGITALAAAWLAAQQTSAAAWLSVWMAELALAAILSLALTALKAKSQGSSLWSSTGLKLLLAFMPSMAVGGILTLVLYLQDDLTRLPGIWMCLYGAAVMTAGAHSVPAIPVMGALFICAGAVVLLVTTLPANTMLGLGLGLIHIVFGVVVWRRHGG